MDLKDTYNKIAVDWHAEHKTYDWWKPGTDAFISKGFKVLGVDISDKLIEIAKAETPEAEFKVMDMRDIASLPQEFDAVFAQASLLHIPKKQAPTVLAGLASRLMPGALLYVAVKAIRPGGVEEHILTEENYGYPYQRFFSYFSMDELKKYFLDLGLAIVYEKSDMIGKTEWLQIVGKRS